MFLFEFPEETLEDEVFEWEDWDYDEWYQDELANWADARLEQLDEERGWLD